MAASRIRDSPEPYPRPSRRAGGIPCQPPAAERVWGRRSSPGSTRPVIMRRPQAPFNGDGSYCDGARGQLLWNRPWIEQVQKRMPAPKLWISTNAQTTRPDGLAVGRGYGLAWVGEQGNDPVPSEAQVLQDVDIPSTSRPSTPKVHFTPSHPTYPYCTMTRYDCPITLRVGAYPVLHP